MTMQQHRTTVAISMGDPAGIGAEVLAAALAAARAGGIRPLVYGDPGVWARACALMGVEDRLPRVPPGEAAPPDGALVVVSQLGDSEAPWGKPSRAGGLAQKAYLEAALDAVLRGEAEALCTGPIHKGAIRDAGFPFPGHTEYLQERLGAKRVVMMLAGPVLRVALATTHLAVRDVSSHLTTDGLVDTLRITHQALRTSFRIDRPAIAVCGLNPHAGEGGLFGDEEARIILPAIEAARREGIDAQGPYPADGLFPRAAHGGWDTVLAMYHDQGLIPVKTVHRETAVNVTLGLPIVRTSPDHGVAYDIAGTGVADPTSTLHALELAQSLARR
jgi:4-hydroxythreonine-4-phosphate dehydrogenase